MLFRVFFVYSVAPETFQYCSTSLPVEASKRPETWEEMQPVYAHIKQAVGAKVALIFGIATEADYQEAPGEGHKQLVYSQGNHFPEKARYPKEKSDDSDD
jgi:hypothetical protein